MKIDIVTKNDNSLNRKTERKTEKRRYQAPRLLMIGSIQNLTAGGSGGASENNQGGQPKKP